MLQTVQRSTTSSLSLARTLHSTSSVHEQALKAPNQGRQKNSSRTRLSDDLKPSGGRRDRLEVASKEQNLRDTGRRSFPQERKLRFSRDTLPHIAPGYKPPVREGYGDVRKSRGENRGREAVYGRATKEHPPRPVDEKHQYGSRDRERRQTGSGSTRTIPLERHIERSQKFTQPGCAGPTPSKYHDGSQPPKKIHNDISIPTEFYHPPSPTTSQNAIPDTTSNNAELPARFTSPPLMSGILSCLMDVIGPTASPTPIQSLSLKWLLNSTETQLPKVGKTSEWKQFLLASETGSGKSIAYLLPLLQNLKQSELNPPLASDERPIIPKGPQRALNPRALILAPTHELARQLSGFAKALLHEVKLRVLCASRMNLKNTKEKDQTSSSMVAQFEEEMRKNSGAGEIEIRKERFPVDLVVGTPMKLLEMVRGRGWDRKEVEEDVEDEKDDGNYPKPRRGRDKMVGFGKWRGRPEMGLANVEWVIVDEADVLFDPDFQETTRQLLADISEARGTPVPASTRPSLTGAPPTPTNAPSSPENEKQPLNYPFNLILTSATIPSALAYYLDKHHPKLMRLASPNLHHLPRTLQTEYVNWTGGNKYADIERRIRRVWAEDSSFGGMGISSHADANAQDARLSKVLIFCNKSNKVDDLGKYLEERGIKNVALTSTSDQRKRGSNHHLDGFLRTKPTTPDASSIEIRSPDVAEGSKSNPKEDPHVMITTSLLSRGLDFSPSIRHVFIVDEPRNMIDFLHRAGRAGRAGERGKVVMFGKMKGRGSASAKDVRKRVGALVA